MHTPDRFAVRGERRVHRARRRRRRAALVVVAAVLVAAGSAGALAYAHLNANIRSAPLFAGASGNAGVEPVDAFGHRPINLLLIGSDGRNNPADCHLGGDCGPGANADVELVLHVSADRTNATVMSVPRDTVTELPACKDPATHAASAAHVGQINSTLAYGPGCTVAAVHHLTGIPIDHFVMVDFQGVVTMSDAVGGVRVCVSDNVYDPYSHLRLTKGSHSLVGKAALEFLRSRHAFGDGSDLGRTYSQHLFLSALIRNLKSAGTLANPRALYDLSDAATRALTVDPGLDSISSLVGLAADLDQVPTERITFTTMPSTPDPANAARVVVAPSATALFSAIAKDRPLTSPRPAPTASATTTPPTGPSGGPTTTVAKPSVKVTDAHAATAAGATGCAPVSHQRTVAIGGRPMTPIQAFAASAHIPLSAP